MIDSALHTPVMADECISNLVTDPDGVYVDATLGMGGYSERILKKLSDKGRLFAFDLDDDALREAGSRLAEYPNFISVKANFSAVKVELFRFGITEITGIVFDLGVSSLMLDKPEKGFSYRFDGPLDMRMDRSGDLTAEYILNNYKERALADIFYKYGEEVQSRRIAANICRIRKSHALKNTNDLAKAVSTSVPERFLNKSLSRIFQALRIVVNDELDNLQKALDRSAEILQPGGRLIAVSYHSLEDRMVKEFIKLHTSDCLCPPKVPVCNCGHQADMKIHGKRKTMATREEISENSRARSAVMRAAEKLPEIPES